MTDKWMPEVGQEVNFKYKKHQDDSWNNDKTYTGTVEFINEHGCVLSGAWGFAFFDYGEEIVQFHPIQTEADKYRDEQIKAMLDIKIDGFKMLHSSHAEKLYDAGCRILAPDERIVKPLNAKQYAELCGYRDLDCDQIDAVQRELKVID